MIATLALSCLSTSIFKQGGGQSGTVEPPKVITTVEIGANPLPVTVTKVPIGPVGWVN